MNGVHVADWLHGALGSEDRKNRSRKASSVTVYSYLRSHFEANILDYFLPDVTNIRA